MSVCLSVCAQCASLCDANDAGCCCDPGAVLQLTTTIDDSSYGPQGGFLGYSGSNHSTHSVRFVPPVLTGLPAPGSPGSFTRTLTYEICMTANNGEGWIHCPGRRTDGWTDGRMDGRTDRQIHCPGSSPEVVPLGLSHDS
jgi:hypothetical protein